MAIDFSKLNMWKRISITLGIRNRIGGGIPNDPELIKGWVAANMKSATEEAQQKIVTATLAELPAMTEEKADGMWTTFKVDPKGIYIEGRQVKAMFKECANILRDKLIDEEKKSKSKDEAAKNLYTNLKSKVAERLFVEEDHIHILKEGKPLPKSDGNEERAIHVLTPQGPRSALKRVDFVAGPATLKFNVRYLDENNKGVVSLDLIKAILEFGGWNGLGADRSQGNGLFTVVEIQEIS